MVKFADDTVVVGQISHNDESSYRQEVTELVDWCGENSLCINVGKTKELIVDFRTKQHVPPLPLFINGAVVERVPSFKYLGVHISEDLEVGHKHLQHPEKGPPAPLFPQEAEAGWPQYLSAGGFLQVCGGEYSHILHHHLVWELHCCKQEGVAAGGKKRPEDHTEQSPIHRDYLH